MNANVSLKEFSEFVNLSSKWVSELTKKGIFEKRKDGKFDLKKNTLAYIQYLKKQGEPDEMKKAKTRREISKARLQELLTEEKEKSLVSREEVLSCLREMISEARQVLLQIPYRLMEPLSAESDPKAIFLAIKNEVYDSLSRLSRGKEKMKERGLLGH